MPKFIDLSEELKKANAQIKTDPDHKFPVVGKLAALWYRMLLEDGLENDMNLTAAIEYALTEYYRHKSAGPTTGQSKFNATTAEELKLLASLWEVPIDDAVRLLVEKVASATLDSELERRERIEKLNNRTKRVTSSS